MGGFFCFVFVAKEKTMSSTKETTVVIPTKVLIKIKAVVNAGFFDPIAKF